MTDELRFRIKKMLVQSIIDLKSTIPPKAIESRNYYTPSEVTLEALAAEFDTLSEAERIKHEKSLDSGLAEFYIHFFKIDSESGIPLLGRKSKDDLTELLNTLPDDPTEALRELAKQNLVFLHPTVFGYKYEKNGKVTYDEYTTDIVMADGWRGQFESTAYQSHKYVKLSNELPDERAKLERMRSNPPKKPSFLFIHKWLNTKTYSDYMTQKNTWQESVNAQNSKISTMEIAMNDAQTEYKNMARELKGSENNPHLSKDLPQVPSFETAVELLSHPENAAPEFKVFSERQQHYKAGKKYGEAPEGKQGEPQPTVEVKQPEPQQVVEEVKPEIKMPEALLDEIERDCKENNYPERLFPDVKNSIAKLCSIQADKNLDEQQKGSECRGAMLPLLNYMFIKTYPYKNTTETIIDELKSPGDEGIPGGGATYIWFGVHLNSSNYKKFIEDGQRNAEENPKYLDELLGGNLKQMLGKVADKTTLLPDSLGKFLRDNIAQGRDKITSMIANDLQLWADNRTMTIHKDEIREHITKYVGLSIMAADRARTGDNEPGRLEEAYRLSYEKGKPEAFWQKFSETNYGSRAKEIANSLISSKNPRADIDKFFSQEVVDFGKSVTSGKLYNEMRNNIPEDSFKALEGHLTSLKENQNQKDTLEQNVEDCAMVCSYLALCGLTKKNPAAVRGHEWEIMSNIGHDKGFRKSIVEIAKDPAKIQKLLEKPMDDASKSMLGSLESKDVSKFMDEPASSLSEKSENSVKNEAKEEVEQEVVEDGGIDM